MTYRIRDKRTIRRLERIALFHGIPDDILIRLAHRRSRLVVPDRWSAIDLLVRFPGLIPVPDKISTEPLRGED